MKKIFIGLLTIMGYIGHTLCINSPQTPQGAQQRPFYQPPEPQAPFTNNHNSNRRLFNPPTPPSFQNNPPSLRKKRTPEIDTINLFKQVTQGNFDNKNEEEKNTQFKKLITIAREYNTSESTDNSRLTSKALKRLFPKKMTQGILKSAYALNTPEINPDLFIIAEKIIKNNEKQISKCPVCLDKITPNDKNGIIRLSCCANPVHATCMSQYFNAWKNKTQFNCAACRKFLFNPQDKRPTLSRIKNENTLQNKCNYCLKPCLEQITLTSSGKKIHEDCFKRLLRKYKTLKIEKAQTPDQLSEDDDDFENEFVPLDESLPPFTIQNNNY